MRYIIILIGVALAMIGVVLTAIVPNVAFRNAAASDMAFTMAVIIVVAGVFTAIGGCYYKDRSTAFPLFRRRDRLVP
jgi:hypothetical protein